MLTDTPLPPTKPARGWLAAALLLAVVFQSVAVSMSPAIARDGINFIQIAQSLGLDPVRTMREADQHPGYPIMIVSGRWLVSPLIDADNLFSWIWGARLASGVFGLAVVVMVWLLARRVFNEKIAGIAAFLIAALPAFRLNAADVLSDTPHLFFYLLATWFVIEGWRKQRLRWFAGAGAAAGVAYWIRPEGLSVVMVASVVLPLWAWTRRDMTARAVTLFVVVMLLATIVVASPYWIISGKLTSKATTKPYLPPPEEAHAFPADGWCSAVETDGLAPSPPEVEAPSGWTILCNGTVELGKTLAKCLRWAAVIPLLLGAFIGGVSRSDNRSRVMICGLLLLHLALLAWLYYAGRYISQRHLMPPLALLMPWVALGTHHMASGLVWLIGFRGTEKTPAAREVVMGVFMTALVVAMLWPVLTPMHADEIPLVETSLVLGRKYARKDDQVITNTKYVLFYSQIPGKYVGKLAHEPVLRPTQAGPPYRFVVINLNTNPLSSEWERTLEEKYRPMTVFGIESAQVRTLILR